MRRLLVAVGVILAAAVPVQAQDDGAVAVIEKALKAQGGADKMAALKAYTAKGKGTVVLMDTTIDFTIEVFAQKRSKLKEAVKLSVNDMNINIVKVVVGDSGWQSIEGQVTDLTKEEMKEHEDDQYIDSITDLLPLTSDKSFKLSPLDEIKVGDKACVGVQVAKKDKRDVKLYFDKKTNLLVKMDYRGPHPVTKEEVAHEKLFSDYKEFVPGLKLAAKELYNVDGAKFIDSETIEIRSMEKFDDSVFARPK
jgi:hypothetical protein